MTGRRRCSGRSRPSPATAFTLLPHGEDGGEEEWIVPVAAVARITLRQAEEREPLGFSLPAA